MRMWSNRDNKKTSHRSDRREGAFFGGESTGKEELAALGI
jgi:hypothetical protein